MVDTFDEQVRKNAERARSRGQSPRSTRATTGNAQDGKLRDTFRESRSKVRGAARAAGRVGGAAVAETAGVVGEVAGGAAEGAGLRDKAARAGRTAQTTAQRVAGRGAGAARNLAGKGASALKFGGRLLGPAGAAASVAATTPTDELPAKASRLFPPSAVATAATDFGIRRARGEGLGQAFSGTARGAIAPVSLGLVDQPEDDPFRGTKPSPLDLVSGDGDQDRNRAAEINATTQGGGQGAQAPGVVPPAAAPPAGTRGAFQGGQRVTPAAGTGSITNETTGAVTDLNFPQQERPGLRAAAQPESEQLEGTNRRVLDRLSEQAKRGGVASAFGALNAGGNVLQQEATERQRQEQRQSQSAELSNKLSIALDKSATTRATLGQKENSEFQSNLRTTQDAIAKARESGDQGAVDRELDAAFRVAIEKPDSAQGLLAGVEASQELSDLAGSGILDALVPGTERGLVDYLGSLSEGGEPVVSLDPENTTRVNFDNGTVEQLSPDGSTFQELVSFSDLSRRTQDLLRSKGVIKVGETEQNPAGVQQGDPTRTGVRAFQTQ